VRTLVLARRPDEEVGHLRILPIAPNTGHR
jgi:hypothetical protein